MAEPSLLDLLVQHEQGIAGSMVLSTFFSATYAIGSEFGLKKGVQGVFIGCVFSGAGWFFLAEYIHLAVYFVVLVALGGSYLPFPLIRAYIRRQDKLADKLLDKAQTKTGVD
jgi:hypothetical protein